MLGNMQCYLSKNNLSAKQLHMDVDHYLKFT